LNNILKKKICREKFEKFNEKIGWKFDVLVVARGQAPNLQFGLFFLYKIMNKTLFFMFIQKI
tara:strand:- start:172 stop:357 length:186 start_codon:yes stop_codon:yes gene_type:complete